MFPSVPRLCVTAFSGGGGKTLLALGLARTLVERGIIVKPFKKGPDYIDAAWLTQACRNPATNLDPFFLTPEALKALFCKSLVPRPGEALPGLALLEGNRGLFDGLDAKGTCSTAAIARLLGMPIVLSLDCTKMTRTAAALVQGVLNFENGLIFLGVVLNNVGSSRHARLVRDAIEAHTDLPVLGALPRLAKTPLPERHMGIASFGSRLAEDADKRLAALAAFIKENLDVSRIAAEAARLTPKDGAPCAGAPAARPDAITPPAAPLPRIGFVRDAAFWFYYEENLRALKDAGAELVPIALATGDATRDAALAAERLRALDGLYLGGGFPEDHAQALSASPALALIRTLAKKGMPIYAECGGFMLLARSLDLDGSRWPMAGLFPVDVRFTKTPQGLGYVEACVVRENPFFPVGLRLRGHEFHYSRCVWPDETPSAAPQDAPAPDFAMRLSRGTGMGRSTLRNETPLSLPPLATATETALSQQQASHDEKPGAQGGDGLTQARVWAAYTHIFAPAVPCWAPNFIAAARAFATEKTTQISSKTTGTENPKR